MLVAVMPNAIPFLCQWRVNLKLFSLCANGTSAGGRDMLLMVSKPASLRGYYFILF